MAEEVWVPWPDLEAMVKDAERLGLWMRLRATGAFFQPEALRHAWAQGTLRYGALDWQLVSSDYRLEYITRRRDTLIEKAIREFDAEASK